MNIRDLLINLPKGFKLSILIALQIIIIIILLVAVSIFTQSSDRASIINIDQDSNIPQEKWNEMKDRIWRIANRRIDNINNNSIDDIVIRDGTYTENVSDIGGIKSYRASFLVDIDSIKQTYDINIGWTNSDSIQFTSNTVSVECPPKSLMKYPEVECYGTTTTTASPEIYLPYTKPNGDKGDYYFMIQQDFSDVNKINVSIRGCDYEKYKKEADDYLKSTGMELDRYKITYEEYTTDRVCPN